jgi:hypothetical protein
MSGIALTTLPVDVLETICEELILIKPDSYRTAKRHAARFGCTCRHLRAVMLPHLLRDLVLPGWLPGNESSYVMAIAVLTLLRRTPKLRRHVRRLALNQFLICGDPNWRDELSARWEEAVTCLCMLLPHMVNLHTLCIRDIDDLVREDLVRQTLYRLPPSLHNVEVSATGEYNSLAVMFSRVKMPLTHLDVDPGHFCRDAVIPEVLAALAPFQETLTSVRIQMQLSNIHFHSWNDWRWPAVSRLELQEAHADMDELALAFPNVTHLRIWDCLGRNARAAPAGRKSNALRWKQLSLLHLVVTSLRWFDNEACAVTHLRVSACEWDVDESLYLRCVRAAAPRFLELEFQNYPPRRLARIVGSPGLFALTLSLKYEQSAEINLPNSLLVSVFVLYPCAQILTNTAQRSLPAFLKGAARKHLKLFKLTVVGPELPGDSGDSDDSGDSGDSGDSDDSDDSDDLDAQGKPKGPQPVPLPVAEISALARKCFERVATLHTLSLRWANAWGSKTYQAATSDDGMRSCVEIDPVDFDMDKLRELYESERGCAAHFDIKSSRGLQRTLKCCTQKLEAGAAVC